jgi:hypothetical protein
MGMLDGGDELQGAAALGTVFHIEHAYESPGFRPSGRRSPFKTIPVGLMNSRAQLIRAGAKGGGGSWSAERVLALTGAVGRTWPLGVRMWPRCGGRVMILAIEGEGQAESTPLPVAGAPRAHRPWLVAPGAVAAARECHLFHAPYVIAENWSRLMAEVATEGIERATAQ